MAIPAGAAGAGCGAAAEVCRGLRVRFDFAFAARRGGEVFFRAALGLLFFLAVTSNWSRATSQFFKVISGRA